MGIFESNKKLKDEIKGTALALRDSYETKMRLRDASINGHYGSNIVNEQIVKKTIELESLLEDAQRVLNPEELERFMMVKNWATRYESKLTQEEINELEKISIKYTKETILLNLADLKAARQKQTQVFEKYIQAIRGGELNLEKEARKLAVKYGFPLFRINRAMEAGEQSTQRLK